MSQPDHVAANGACAPGTPQPRHGTIDPHELAQTRVGHPFRREQADVPCGMPGAICVPFVLTVVLVIAIALA